MCGIVGICGLGEGRPVEEGTLRGMLGMIRHRGPDQFGIYLDGNLGLGNARLSIIDLGNGQQPIANEDGTLWIVFNGEIFNDPELRDELEGLGHRFRTNCDTETVLHAYQEYGPDCLARFNGQFAIAIWNARDRTLFMARDRLGVRPLFYTVADGSLVFASEIKAILAVPGIRAELDPVALEQIFTFWSTLSPRTSFRGIQELPPGNFMLVRDGRITLKPYWEMAFPEPGPVRSKAEYLDELRELLIDATRIRLRADVPVGAYLSGGLDSSLITAIIRNYTGNPLETFSISFSDAHFDESEYQTTMARHLGTHHHVVHASHADIGKVFPEVVWHAETPIMRTSPAPMFLLSGLVRKHQFKVVLTGEGADEFLAGYDIFKEAKIRRFWAGRPDSSVRPALFSRIYPWISDLSQSSYASSFFGLGLAETGSRDYSHHLRWRTTGRGKRFFSEELKASIQASAGTSDLAPAWPEGFDRWDPLQQAQYLEVSIFMSQYLLSSQGDRMGMGHSVEGRFPFLDHRVVTFCNQLPPTLKLKGLTEKYLLKELSRQWLPADISDRPKQPFRAPVHRAFFNDSPPDYLEQLLSPGALAHAGCFKPEAVGQLVAKLRQGSPLSETDDMALAGIISTQLVERQFVSGFRLSPPLDAADDVKLVIDQKTATGEKR